MKTPISLSALFWTFLKIGSAAFGGSVALVAVVQEDLVEQKKWLKDDTILEGLSLGAMMPGPLAVNVVTYLGFHMRSWKGALVCMLGVLIPSFILVTGLSAFYFQYQDAAWLDQVFSGIMPAVVAIILSVAINMGRKAIKDYKQVIIMLLATLAMVLGKGFYLTLLIIFLAALLGLWFYQDLEESGELEDAGLGREFRKDIWWMVRWILIPVGILIALMSYGSLYEPMVKNLRDLLVTFGGMSVTLFGGGYVFIPAMEEVVVGEWQWLTTKEFADGIAMGQVTPGPIMISAAFIGYKVQGIAGAAIATIGMFLPTGMLMAACGKYYGLLRDHPKVKAAFLGIKPAVVGMIAAAVVTIGAPLVGQSMAWVIFGLMLFCAQYLKWNALYLIPLGAILGVLSSFLIP